MTLLSLLVFIIVIAILLYLVCYIPDATGQTIARVAILIFAILWLLRGFGVLGELGSVRV